MKAGVTTELLVSTYPWLYHMAAADGWPSISKHGLLSTSALLDLFEVALPARRAIESRHRPESVRLSHPRYGTAVIRDQKPMREAALRGCLTDCTARQWYEFLNRHVFFWVTEERVVTLLSAKAYRDDAHLVITVDTEGILEDYGEKVLLSPINSGSTIYRPVERGLASFRPLRAYPFDERRSIRGRRNAVAELAIPYAVPRFLKFVVRVEKRRRDRILDTVFRR